MDQKMARVDISLIVRDKSARIKKGRCIYHCQPGFSQRSGESDQRQRRSRRYHTTPPCHAGTDRCPEKNTQTVPDHNPYNLPISCKWS